MPTWYLVYLSERPDPIGAFPNREVAEDFAAELENATVVPHDVKTLEPWQSEGFIKSLPTA